MDALDSKSISVVLAFLSQKDLCGSLNNLHFDEIISPQTRRVLEGRGMPLKGQAGKFGNLIIKFDICFPEELSFEKKKRVIELLKC